MVCIRLKCHLFSYRLLPCVLFQQSRTKFFVNDKLIWSHSRDNVNKQTNECQICLVPNEQHWQPGTFFPILCTYKYDKLTLNTSVLSFWVNYSSKFLFTAENYPLEVHVTYWWNNSWTKKSRLTRKSSSILIIFHTCFIICYNAHLISIPNPFWITTECVHLLLVVLKAEDVLFSYVSFPHEEVILMIALWRQALRNKTWTRLPAVMTHSHGQHDTLFHILREACSTKSRSFLFLKTSKS